MRPTPTIVLCAIALPVLTLVAIAHGDAPRTEAVICPIAELGFPLPPNGPVTSRVTVFPTRTANVANGMLVCPSTVQFTASRSDCTVDSQDHMSCGGQSIARPTMLAGCLAAGLGPTQAVSSAAPGWTAPSLPGALTNVTSQPFRPASGGWGASCSFSSTGGPPTPNPYVNFTQPVKLRNCSVAASKLGFLCALTP